MPKSPSLSRLAMSRRSIELMRHAAYRGQALNVPSQFGEQVQRKADHFEVLLGRGRQGRGDPRRQARSRGHGRRVMTDYVVKVGFWLRAYDDYGASGEGVASSAWIATDGVAHATIE
jgi:hypothetical protein